MGAFVAGCGGGGEQSTLSARQRPVSEAGTNVPADAKTEVATVYEKTVKGVPAEIGQWMLEVGVARHGLAFTVGNLVVPPGNANFRLTNPQHTGHDLTIEEVGAGSIKTPVIRDGHSAWVRSSLFAGKKYVFYCSIPGHREAGMEGTITVDPKLKASDLKPFGAGRG